LVSLLFSIQAAVKTLEPRPSLNPVSAEKPPAISLNGLTKTFHSGGSCYVAIQSIDLKVPPGCFLALVGPSGCGKSTVLNLVAGLMEPTEGSVEIFGERLRGLNRHASYMFQQDALLPWKTVLENVRLGLEFRGRDDAECETLSRDWVRRVGLSGFERSYPHQLSGGMRKRVSMAQSWVLDPELVLLDEPFSALDVHTRQRMESEILDLWTGSGNTVMFITHDLEEAIGLSDRVAVLSAGPASRVVAQHEVDLPRPRHLLDIKTEPRFGELYRTIWSDLRQEVLKSYERNTD
jgi:NitT/TauT family transport system ATP-binding protein